MAKSQYPQNEPATDSSRLQAEALHARRPNMGTPYHTSDRRDPTFKIDKSTKRQADAYFDGRDPSQPVVPPTVDTSEAVVRESDLTKHPATLQAERADALRNGDEMRAAELNRALGVQQLGNSYAKRHKIVADDSTPDPEPGYSPANTRTR